MVFDWGFALSTLPMLAEGAVITLQATLISFVLAMVLGLILALAKMSPFALLRVPATWFIEVIRGTPLLVQLFVLFLILPKYGITMPALMTGVIGLGMHYSTYCAEAFRAGINSVPRGQWEAATALQMSRIQMYRRIILPQAIPPVIPSFGNYLISLFKETPLLSSVAVVEIMQQSLFIGSDTFRYIEPITIVGLFFLVCSVISATLVRSLERRMSIQDRPLQQRAI
ncbi:ectoine/hydroxyectoine ABC transporter permease subunit EhuD [Halomonas huangheensis]|uniref:ABC transmembrane type-1 domain-containing protein n=1 Tax=Halomonas huangheensis TaxID=1178482 RepID=W1N629_9GAMM|nr:ectoine/hydroxyectoine ABC transporter permease subunit EhuD [Halomonas huangheensis]ALM50889.1 ectoine/hydroxyectoine ABC transporter permease subunit EhuD [Halomonas huangheensis]ERL51032.1 hypothetical protein BJB45_20790 [Halomonas huangheensis]